MELRTVVTEYAANADAIRAVRTQVFVQEQQIREEDEYDEHDAVCQHVILFDGELPVATGRLNAAQEGRVGRVAVIESHRRRGLGSIVMRRLEELAQQQAQPRVWFHAQVQAIPFYEALGYTSQGEPFMEEGILHVDMEKRFA